MEINKSLEYKVVFTNVTNLNNSKKNENHYGLLELEGNIYEVSVFGNQKELRELLPTLFSSFIEHYFTLKKQNKVVKRWHYISEKGLDCPNMN